MVVVVGEILVDVFPEYRRVGGAPFNFAFHLKRLGHAVRFLTRVGDDENGFNILRLLENSGFDITDVQRDAHRPTGTVAVTLDAAGVPHFDIRKEVAYDHLALDAAGRSLARGTDPEMIYFGTLIQRTRAGCQAVQAFLNGCSRQTTRFFDINLRPPHINDDAIRHSLEQTDLLKLNGDELQDLQTRFGAPEETGPAVRWLMERFGIGTLALTRGSEGSTVIDASGQWTVPAATAGRIIDTVGAGDGYAAVLAAGLLGGMTWDAVIGPATDFAARICGISGAVPEDRAFYNDFKHMAKG